MRKLILISIAVWVCMTISNSVSAQSITDELENRDKEMQQTLIAIIDGNWYAKNLSSDMLVSVLNIGEQVILKNPSMDMSKFERAYVNDYYKSENVNVDIWAAIMKYWATKSVMLQSLDILPKGYFQRLRSDAHIKVIMTSSFVLANLSCFYRDSRYTSALKDFIGDGNFLGNVSFVIWIAWMEPYYSVLALDNSMEEKLPKISFPETLDGLNVTGQNVLVSIYRAHKFATNQMVTPDKRWQNVRNEFDTMKNQLKIQYKWDF